MMSTSLTLGTLKMKLVIRRKKLSMCGMLEGTDALISPHHALTVGGLISTTCHLQHAIERSPSDSNWVSE